MSEKLHHKTKHRKCIIRGCGNTETYTLCHQIPRTEDAKSLWFNAIKEHLVDGLYVDDIGQNRVVCHAHFEDKFLSPHSAKRLKHKSYPTIFDVDVFKKIPNKPDPYVIMGGSKRLEATDNKCDVPKTLKNWHKCSRERLDGQSGSATECDVKIEKAELARGKTCVGCLRGGRQLTTMDSVELVVRPGLPHLACNVATLYKEIVGTCPPAASGGECWSMCAECVNRLTAAYLFKCQCVESLELITADAERGAGDHSGRASDCDTHDVKNEEDGSQTSVKSPQTKKEEHIIIINYNEVTCDMEVDNEVLCETAPHTMEVQCESLKESRVLKTYKAVKTRAVKLSTKSDHNERGTNEVKRCHYCGLKSFRALIQHMETQKPNARSMYGDNFTSSGRLNYLKSTR